MNIVYDGPEMFINDSLNGIVINLSEVLVQVCD